MTACLFILAFFFFFIGLVQLLSPEPAQATRQPYPASSRAAGPGYSSRTAAQPAAVVGQSAAAMGQQAAADVTGLKAAMNYSAPGGGGGSGAPSLGQVRVGEQIRVRHPVQGELTVYVLGRVVYDELWQTQRGPQVPWVPTGSAFSGFWLETNLFLLNWQNRYYLLDEATALSDAEIQRDFAPHAKKFAQSDQTADIFFAYPPASWHIDDIGKFSIRSVEGQGLRNVPGSTGRFVHCSGDGGRALVLEDYESRGGQDVVWTGFKIEESDIKA
jgi:hypothetical protein